MMQEPFSQAGLAAHPPQTGRVMKGIRQGVLCIRLTEVLLMQGAPALGVIYATSHWSLTRLVPLVLFGMASIALVGFVWAFNDWADFRVDRLAPVKLSMPAFRREIRPGVILKTALVLLGVSMGLFALLPRPTLALALSVALLGIFYSSPVGGWKRVPLMSSLAHLIGGLIHFLMGYSLFSPIDRRALLFAPFFSLVFAAGHAFQEVQDVEADRRGGGRTNAVCFGKMAVFLAGVLGFSGAYAYLFILAVAAVVPRPLAWFLPALLLLHLFWSLQSWRAGLTEDSIRRLRWRYRVLIALLGAAMVVLRAY